MADYIAQRILQMHAHQNGGLSLESSPATSARCTVSDFHDLRSRAATERAELGCARSRCVGDALHRLRSFFQAVADQGSAESCSILRLCCRANFSKIRTLPRHGCAILPSFSRSRRWRPRARPGQTQVRSHTRFWCDLARVSTPAPELRHDAAQERYDPADADLPASRPYVRRRESSRHDHALKCRSSPSAASMDNVSWCDGRRGVSLTINGRRSCLQRSRVSVRQIRPRAPAHHEIHIAGTDRHNSLPLTRSPLVLAVLIVHDDDHLAGTDVGQDLIDSDSASCESQSSGSVQSFEIARDDIHFEIHARASAVLVQRGDFERMRNQVDGEFRAARRRSP